MSTDPPPRDIPVPSEGNTTALFAACQDSKRDARQAGVWHLRRVMDAEIAGRRLRLIVDQLGEELGHRTGWKTVAAKRMGISPSTITNILTERRGASLKTIADVASTMGVDIRYFSVASLEGHEHYTDWLGGSPLANGTPIHDDEAWREFQRLGLVESLGLSDEETEWLRRAPARGGKRDVRQLIAAIQGLRGQLPEDEGVAEARRANATDGTGQIRRGPR
jgi:transcriptional regulator with XRE-family HTH domain